MNMKYIPAIVWDIGVIYGVSYAADVSGASGGSFIGLWWWPPTGILVMLITISLIFLPWFFVDMKEPVNKD